MRTFNVDPLAYARAEARAGAGPTRDIVAPNGARFDRAPGVMPGLIAEYAEEREKALAAGDEVAAYVYKILQNSFYGVLGAEGCRYARTEIAGAITSFGKKFLTMARDFFEARGLRVLYGDTDSVFVLSGEAREGRGLRRAHGDGAGRGRGAQCRDRATRQGRVRPRVAPAHTLREGLRAVPDPRLKYSAARSSPGGRRRAPLGGGSKGYAGLLLAADGSLGGRGQGHGGRRGATSRPSRGDFQVELLGLVFSGAGEDELRDFCRAEAAALRRGERDGELVYRKTLRRLADDYGSETPQVRAARLMGWTARRGRVSYVMTRRGPSPWT